MGSRQWRPEACVAIVVAGDEGPIPARARALVDHVGKLRKGNARFATHALLIGDAEMPLPARRFFLDLAEAGGGEVVPLVGTEDVLGDLCAALLEGEDRKAVSRIVRAIARVEGWDKSRDLEPAGGAR